jgi:hypothetical protein
MITTSWSYQQNPSRSSGTQFHGMILTNLELDTLFWASIPEDNKWLLVLGDWVAWIHEVLQLDPLSPSSSPWK